MDNNLLIIFILSMTLLMSVLLTPVFVEENTLEEIKESCESFGAFKVNDTVYTCETKN